MIFLEHIKDTTQDAAPVFALALGDASHTAISGLPPTFSSGPDAFLEEAVCGKPLRVSAGSFFQSSPHSAEALVRAVVSALGDTTDVSRWADLYCGVGLFAATVLRDREVIAVERSGSSTADARINLADRAGEVVESDVESWAPVNCDAVVADPARSGLGRRGVEVVTATDAPVLVLVSCDAASLGRDTQLLGAAGYRHAGSVVLDLFPQTPHVEVVTRFERDAR